MKAWHFLDKSKRLRYSDERKVIAGKRYVTPDKNQAIKICHYGMHGCVDILDALDYAPGPIVCRVDISGEVIKGAKKIAGRARKVLWMYDASRVLRKFARLCALDVIHLWNPPEIVVRYLKTGDESIRANAADAAAYAAYAYAAAADADAAYAAGAAAYAAGAVAAHAADTAAYAVAAATANIYALRKKQARRLYRMIIQGRPKRS